jgi:TPR repeat protein
MTLPPATISSVPINDYAEANEELARENMEVYFPCCGKSICKGCLYSCVQSGNYETCPYCKSDRMGKTDEERVDELMKRVEANDAGSMMVLGSNYYHGQLGLQQYRGKALELYTRAAALGSSQAHFALGNQYDAEGDSKKANYEAAAMAGHEFARLNLGIMEGKSGNMERAVKHWMIAASGGNYLAMRNLLIAFNKGLVSRDTMDSTLTAYNNACVEMRSDARDAAIRLSIARIGAR